MATINTNKPLLVDALYIKGESDPVTNSVVFLLDHFVIVARDQNDTAPIWYNVDLIEKMDGVTAETYKMKVGF